MTIFKINENEDVIEKNIYPVAALFGPLLRSIHFKIGVNQESGIPGAKFVAEPPEVANITV
jgi:hypothetical protein